METSSITSSSLPPGSRYLARSLQRSAAAQSAVTNHLARLRNQQVIRQAADLRDQTETLAVYLRRVRPTGGQGIATAAGSAMGFNLAASNATLGSVEQINTGTTATTPRAPLWTGISTSQAGVAGTYDGSLGTTTLTVTVTSAGIRGITDAKLEITDNASPYKKKITVRKNDPLSEVYSLGNGLEFTFGDGIFVADDTFLVELQTGTNVRPDPDGTFDGSGGVDANTEVGLPVTAGTFTINGELITVAANDTINSVLGKINASDAGVTGIFDATNELVALVQDTPGSGPNILPDNDTSGFLAAMKLDSAVVVPGTDTDLDKPIDQVPVLTAISSGSLLINATPILIDVSTDSVADVIDAINASAAGVTAELVNSSYLNIRQNTTGNLTLDSNSTEFFETFSITPGTIQGATRGSRPSDTALHRISEQTGAIVRGLNRLFADHASANSNTSQLDGLLQQIATLVTEELKAPLTAVGARIGFTYDTTDSRPSAFSPLNAAELRRGFRWHYPELAALYAGSPQSGTEGALNRFVALLDETIRTLSTPGSLVDEHA